jgi:hypothetical protein
VGAARSGRAVCAGDAVFSSKMSSGHHQQEHYVLYPPAPLWKLSVDILV